jgi:hypothetical protein
MPVCGLERGWIWPTAAVRTESPVLTAELHQLREQFRLAALEATALNARLTDAQFSWKPAPGVWSIGECLSHLNVTARLCMPKLNEGISEGIRAGLYGDGPFRYGWLDRLIQRASEPPSRWHVWSPSAFRPVPGESRDDVLTAFHEVQRQFGECLRRADGLDLVRVRVTSPVARWRRFSLGAAFAVLAAHERRHLWQARCVTALPRYPR